MNARGYFKANYTMNFKEIQLTFDEFGHTIHNITMYFHPTDQWVVYDVRNQDSQISSTGSCIRIVNEVLRKLKNCMRPLSSRGLGAVSLSPKVDKVTFIHGIRNAM